MKCTLLKFITTSNFNFLQTLKKSQDGSNNIRTDNGLDGQVIEGGGEEFCLLFTAAMPAQGPSQPPSKWVPAPPSSTLKLLGREIHNLPSSNVIVYTSSPTYIFRAWYFIN
jgi:hypothetical protein